MVGAEQEDVRGVREQQAVLRLQRGRRPLGQAAVRGRDAAADGEVAQHAPDDEHEHDREERERDEAAPGPAPALAAYDLTAGAATVFAERLLSALRRAVAPVGAGERHLSLRTTAAVDLVRLVSRGGHPAGYGTR